MRATDEHPQNRLSFLCQETSHVDVFAQQIEAATLRKTHSMMLPNGAKLSLSHARVCVCMSLSQYVKPLHGSLSNSARALLFLDTD